MKITFSKIQIKTLDGQEIKDIQKLIGNVIRNMSTDVELANIARGIHAGDQVEITQHQAEQIKEVLRSDKSNLMPFVVREVIAFIESIK